MILMSFIWEPAPSRQTRTLKKEKTTMIHLLNLNQMKRNPGTWKAAWKATWKAAWKQIADNGWMADLILHFFHIMT